MPQVQFVTQAAAAGSTASPVVGLAAGSPAPAAASATSGSVGAAATTLTAVVAPSGSGVAATGKASPSPLGFQGAGSVVGARGVVVVVLGAVVGGLMVL